MTNRNSISIISNNQTMSSLEIAKLTGKRHTHVIRDIREMCESIKDDPDLVHDLNNGIITKPKQLRITWVSITCNTQDCHND